MLLACWSFNGSQVDKNSLPTKAESPLSVQTGLSNSVIMQKETIKVWIKNWLSQEMEIEPEKIDFNKPFVNTGIDSLTSILLIEDLEKWLNIKINPLLIIESTSIESFSVLSP